MFGHHLSNVRKKGCKVSNPPVVHISLGSGSLGGVCGCDAGAGAGAGAIQGTDEGSAAGLLTVNVNGPVRLQRSSTTSDLLPCISQSLTSPRRRSNVSVSVNVSANDSNRLDLRNLLSNSQLTSTSAPATPVESLDSCVGDLTTTNSMTSNLTHSTHLTPSVAQSKSGNSSGAVTSGSTSRFMRKSSSSMMNPECVLKDLAHPSHSEVLKAHSALTMKLIKTGSHCLSLPLPLPSN